VHARETALNEMMTALRCAVPRSVMYSGVQARLACLSSLASSHRVTKAAVDRVQRCRDRAQGLRDATRDEVEARICRAKDAAAGCRDTLLLALRRLAFAGVAPLQRRVDAAREAITEKRLQADATVMRARKSCRRVVSSLAAARDDATAACRDALTFAEHSTVAIIAHVFNVSCKTLAVFNELAPGSLAVASEHAAAAKPLLKKALFVCSQLDNYLLRGTLTAIIMRLSKDVRAYLLALYEPTPCCSDVSTPGGAIPPAFEDYPFDTDEGLLSDAPPSLS
jgi:hypothetical protein